MQQQQPETPLSVSKQADQSNHYSGQPVPSYQNRMSMSNHGPRQNSHGMSTATNINSVLAASPMYPQQVVRGQHFMQTPFAQPNQMANMNQFSRSQYSPYFMNSQQQCINNPYQPYPSVYQSSMVVPSQQYMQQQNHSGPSSMSSMSVPQPAHTSSMQVPPVQRKKLMQICDQIMDSFQNWKDLTNEMLQTGSYGHASETPPEFKSGYSSAECQSPVTELSTTESSKKTIHLIEPNTQVVPPQQPPQSQQPPPVLVPASIASPATQPTQQISKQPVDKCVNEITSSESSPSNDMVAGKKKKKKPES